MSDNWPVRNLFGLSVHALSMNEVLTIVEGAIERRERLLIGVVNAAKMVNMRRDVELDRAVRSAHLILADGVSVVLAARLLRKSLPERVPGIDLMTRLFERGNDRGFRVYCLGAADDVLDAVARTVQAEYPGVKLVGKHHGYFSEGDEPAIAAEIKAAQPDILFVAMSSPKKELFLSRWVSEMDVPVCHGVGGAFDVMAGKVKRAPRAWQKLGMEWLYRIVQEPRRMWRRYLVTNTLFGWMLLSELVGQLLPRRVKKA